jgi:hypothetical protein
MTHVVDESFPREPDQPRARLVSRLLRFDADFGGIAGARVAVPR